MICVRVRPSSLLAPMLASRQFTLIVRDQNWSIAMVNDGAKELFKLFRTVLSKPVSSLWLRGHGVVAPLPRSSKPAAQ